MVEGRIGYRYAKSLFSLAQEKKVMNEVKEDMVVLRDTCEESRELRNFLSSPLISTSKKRSVLEKLFKGQLKTDFSIQLVDLLARKGREPFLFHTAQAFLDIYDKEFHIARGVITSAVKLPKKLVESIRDKMEAELNETLILTEEVDPSLIGGYKIQVGDQLFDGSVAASLRKIKREFQEN
ncbi:MAG: ATP synthase F1 subunit delta [Bacteroidota bacterium]